ncbi:MAG: lmo0937 family membrane protein [Planctomycetes bacterium]|nr:lmo0937 family membrane protein [Planctomycetota bacterium]
MLYTIAIVLVLLWLLGLISLGPANVFIHALLVIAVVVILIRLISGRKPI